MNKKVGIIIGVVVAVVAIVLGVVFLAPDKDVSVDDPTENITDVMNQDEVADVTEEITPIDLTTVDLSQYGLSTDYEISEAFPTTKGNYYYVCDYGAGAENEFEEYRFFTTEEDVMCARLRMSDVETYIYPIEYIFYDINNDGVEELIVDEKVHVKEYRVFTFIGDEIYFAGEMMNEHGSLYGKNGTVTTVSREFSDEPDSEPWVVYDTFEFTENKLVHKDHGFCPPLDGAEKSEFGTKMDFTRWE